MPLRDAYFTPLLLLLMIFIDYDYAFFATPLIDFAIRRLSCFIFPSALRSEYGLLDLSIAPIRYFMMPPHAGQMRPRRVALYALATAYRR